MHNIYNPYTKMTILAFIRLSYVARYFYPSAYETSVTNQK